MWKICSIIFYWHINQQLYHQSVHAYYCTLTQKSLFTIFFFFLFLISNLLGKPFGYNFIIFKSYTFFFFKLKKIISRLHCVLGSVWAVPGAAPQSLSMRSALFIYTWHPGPGSSASPQCSLRWRYLPALSLAALAQALCLFCCKWFQYLISSLGWNWWEVIRWLYLQLE